MQRTPTVRPAAPDGVDAGPLSESWRQQPGTAVYGTDLPVDQLREALASASPERTPEWRA